VTLAQPSAGAISVSGLQTIFRNTKFIPRGTVYASLPAYINTKLLAAVRVKDDNLFDAVFPKLVLDFDITALRDPILNFTSQLEKTDFNVAGASFIP
jgi:hypothetical protein